MSAILPLAPGERPKPRLAVWELTRACDQTCIHCGPRAGRAWLGELDTAEALKVVPELADMGAGEVVLIGGEASLAGRGRTHAFCVGPHRGPVAIEEPRVSRLDEWTGPGRSDRGHMIRGSSWLMVAVLTGCGPPKSVGESNPPKATDATPARSSEPIAQPVSATVEEFAGPPCPPGEPRGEGFPPWEIRTTFDRCVRGPKERWSVQRDTSDPEGWRHVLTFDALDGTTWTLDVTAPRALARRVDGHLVVLEGKQRATLVSPAGARVWSASTPECGYVDGLAVGWDHAVVFACGYSVVRLDPDGQVAWQVWPFGNHAARNAWIDRSGTTYVTGNGRVAALDIDGKTRWSVSTGFNRAIGRIVWNAAGNLVFDASMDALHSDPESSGGYRFYYEHEPNELFEITRDGEIVRRESYEQAPPARGWPTVLPVPEDGSHRAP